MCCDFDCHLHIGRAKVLAEDIELSVLPGLTGKDCASAIAQYNRAVDITVSGDPSAPPLNGACDTDDFNDDGDDSDEGDEYDDEHEGYDAFNAHDASFLPPAFGGDDYKHTGLPVYAAQLKADAAAKMDTIIDLIDVDVKPSAEEKKLASEMVVPIVATNEVCVPPIVAQNGFPLQEPTETVIIFTQHIIDMPVRGLGLKKYLKHNARKLGVKCGVLWALPAVHTNMNSRYVLSSVLLHARSESGLYAWFWQTWQESTVHSMTDCIDLLAGAYSHAYDAEIYSNLAEYLLTHEKFTLTDSRLIDQGKLTQTVQLRVDDLIAKNSDRLKFLDQVILGHTKTFVCNQLLIRGLIHLSRQPAALQPARFSVDFRRGARIKTSQRSALPSESPQKTATLNRFSGITAPLMW